jgi:hypothetical protein
MHNPLKYPFMPVYEQNLRDGLNNHPLKNINAINKHI